LDTTSTKFSTASSKWRALVDSDATAAGPWRLG
jgi:hypothetical protein